MKVILSAEESRERWAKIRALHEAEQSGGELCPNCKASFEDDR